MSFKYTILLYSSTNLMWNWSIYVIFLIFDNKNEPKKKKIVKVEELVDNVTCVYMCQ